jgi:hypothetical protein
MVGVVGLEDAMVNQGVPLVWILEIPLGPVHEAAVQRPFIELRQRAAEAQAHPEERSS